ncbi:hypothetical protein B0T14DRAFT_40010 [Immersiella caudata]|uniref:Uncharacterized protein n=1 Tax=Immersiella caudata TaxID=314043 RepID=A0AA39XEV4_9PEZI|nr:hypothetical protein B0T14DRAFT_40010 [Immersiella caudata]
MLGQARDGDQRRYRGPKDSGAAPFSVTREVDSSVRAWPVPDRRLRGRGVQQRGFRWHWHARPLRSPGTGATEGAGWGFRRVFQLPRGGGVHSSKRVPAHHQSGQKRACQFHNLNPWFPCDRVLHCQSGHQRSISLVEAWRGTGTSAAALHYRSQATVRLVMATGVAVPKIAQNSTLNYGEHGPTYFSCCGHVRLLQFGLNS